MRKLQGLRFRIHDVQAKRREEAQNAPGVRRARRIVVARHQHELRIRQRGAQSRELDVCVHDRCIGRANLMKNVAADDDDVGRELDHRVERALERQRDVGFALIDSTRSQPLVLAESQMEIGEVNESQGAGGRGQTTSWRDGA